MSENTTYIGDAVYAHFDGCGIAIALNDHRNECLIYLESKVMQALIEFWKAKTRAPRPPEPR